MQFIKMHGAGNDYVYVDAFANSPPDDLCELAKCVSDRHTGIGADGLILILPSTVADAKMRMWNADGSEAGMCGNGIRCVARYLYDSGRVPKTAMTIEAGSGIRDLRINLSGGNVESVTVDMGPPILESSAIPTLLPGDPPLDVPLKLDGAEITATCVSMGNPHCVLFVDELTDDVVQTLGPLIEHHAAFPQRTNVEFARVVSPTEIDLRVWERGSGETQACGTGACAATVAGILTGRTQRKVTCHLPGGDLTVEWPEDGSVFLTGPAVESFRGEWPVCV